jgi:hypothetical protein
MAFFSTQASIWKGEKLMAARLDALANGNQKRIAAALTNVAEHRLVSPAKRLVPVDTGALRASIHAEPAFTTPTYVRVRVVCGGPAAPYAVIIHEDLDMRHAPGTSAKFLSIPMEALKRTFREDLVKHLRILMLLDLQKAKESDANRIGQRMGR